MPRKKYLALTAFILSVACAGTIGKHDQFSRREHDLRVGNIPSDLHPEWENADRCTKCHMTWSREYGYYRGWDRHGYTYDYHAIPPSGFKDPYGLDAEYNPYVDYYFSDWWRGPWLDMAETPDPAMHIDGYGRVNDGTSEPGDFDGPVIVVDPSGEGDAETIQEGVDKASPGTTVFVKSGVYRECVRLKEGIRLWGENAHTTIIDPDFTGSAIRAANNCDISGFTLTGTGMNYKTYDFSSGVHALDCDSTLVIRGNIFDSNAVFGILVECSRRGGTPPDPEKRYIEPKKALDNLDYDRYPNPRIIGNTFYVIGERAVYSIHAAPEIANNVFIGNVKTLGMTQHSRPFIHHNVFYRNNVTVNMNRSMPIMCYNIFYKNYWGQRVIEGALPTIHDNVTWNSPYYKEFREDGSPILYLPHPGTGEIEVDPGFSDPDAGDFRLSASSPLTGRGTGATWGLLAGPGIQEPPVVPCKRSYAEEFNNRNESSDSIVAEIKKRLGAIRTLQVSYTIEYDSFMDVAYDRHGDQASVSITAEPVSGMRYDVPSWRMEGNKRRKVYRSELFDRNRTLPDSGTVLFDGEKLHVLSGRFRDICGAVDDPFNVGEKVFRENVGGLYLDYDQYLNGAIGPIGTFLHGYLTVFGGEVSDERVSVDGHECVVIIYPNIGTDQKFRFYLDPDIGYMPRRLEQYIDTILYRRIDGYRYENRGGASVPVEATITDYAIREPHVGKIAGKCTMKVKTITVNDGRTELPGMNR